MCMEVVDMNHYTHGRTCVYNINYHIVWCVKYRRKVLTPQIAERLYELVNMIGEKKGFMIVECKVGEGDHVHQELMTVSIDGKAFVQSGVGTYTIPIPLRFELVK